MSVSREITITLAITDDKLSNRKQASIEKEKLEAFEFTKILPKSSIKNDRTLIDQIDTRKKLKPCADNKEIHTLNDLTISSPTSSDTPSINSSTSITSHNSTSPRFIFSFPSPTNSTQTSVYFNDNFLQTNFGK